MADGSAVVERFVAQAGHPAAEDEHAILLGWRDVVEGIFEVHHLDRGAAALGR
ncbi:hypothetical protein ACH4TE_29825 [Streptomyces sioyaensis]|uniref:hypothetical protein n=1 Tax=Streptomyces sioyaensis TaxID=67364 RepID=UPI0037983937